MPVARENAGTFENPPGGVHPAISIGWFDIGIQPGFEGKPTHQVVGLFELVVLDDNGQEIRMTQGSMAGKRFLISKTYTLSLGENANLSIDLTSWRSRVFTEVERQAGYELSQTLGKPCNLNVLEYVKQNGQPGVKIAAIMPATRGGPVFQRETPAGYVPEWIQKKMAGAQAAPAHSEDIPF